MSTYSRRKKVNRSSGDAAVGIDYKDVNTLKNYITETGKIVPCRITGINARNQRLVSKAIKYARFIGLLPYCDSHR